MILSPSLVEARFLEALMPAPELETTRILSELSGGRQSAADELLPLVYRELRVLAASHLRRERKDHTLAPTALVHEAYLRLVEQTRTNWHDRAHFFAVAAEAIRRVLVDHARKRGAVKRGRDWRRVTLGDAMVDDQPRQVDVIALNDALDKLQQLHERQSQVVQLRYFAGLTTEETAYVLGVNRSTVVDDWAVARAWLLSELGGKDHP